MTTRILDLPSISVTMVVGGDESWIDSWAYLDGAGEPISLDGIVLRGALRAAPDSDAVALHLLGDGAPSAPPGELAGAILIGGEGRNVLGLSVPPETIRLLPRRVYVFGILGEADGEARRIAGGKAHIVDGAIR